MASLCVFTSDPHCLGTSDPQECSKPFPVTPSAPTTHPLIARMWGVCVHEEAQDVGALAVAAGLRVVRNDPLVAGRLLSATSIALACIYRACLHLSRLLASIALACALRLCAAYASLVCPRASIYSRTRVRTCPCTVCYAHI